MKKRIYALIEVKDRELLGKILFGLKMANLGYSIVIGKKNSLYTYQKYLKSGIFYFKGMGKKNIEPMRSLIKNGHKIVGFDEEGLIANQVSGIHNRINKDCMNMVEYFFTVGLNQKMNTLKVYPKYKNKIHQIGNPRFDLMKKKNNYFYNDEVNKIKKKYGKFVLFATQFTLIKNHLYKDILKFIRYGQKDYLKNNWYFIKADFEDQKKIEKKLLAFFNYFPKKNPNIKILIKPHPVEIKEFWDKFLKKINCKNLVLADEKFKTNSYLLASEFNVGTNCHTAIESFIAEKPTVNFRAQKKDSINVSKLIRSISGKDILNISELDKIIINWFNKGIRFRNKLSKKEKKILNLNIKNIYKESFYFFEKKIRSIKVLVKNDKDQYSNFICFIFFKILKKIKNFYHTYNYNKDELDFYSAKFSSLTLDEFNYYVKKFTIALNEDYKKYNVKEIYPGCFCLEKK